MIEEEKFVFCLEIGLFQFGLRERHHAPADTRGNKNNVCFFFLETLTLDE